MKTPSHPVYTLGLDLADKRHTLCVLDANGKIVDERKIPNTRASLSKLAKKYPGARLAMEVGSHSPWISRLFQQLDLEVYVANPRKLRAIYQNERKSDELDARMLARLARVDPELLHPVEHVSEQSQRDLARVKLRDNLVRQRVDVISSVRFILKSMGVRLPSPNTNCFAKRARTLLEGKEPELLAAIEPSLQVIDTMTVNIRELDREIERLCEEEYPETHRLRQIRGIGPITALTFLLTIEDNERFERPRDVGAFLGLVPRRDQSGDVDKALRISKCGNAYLRRLLVGSANYLLGPFGEDCDLRRHGLKLAERGGRGAKKKAVVAIARKLAVLMYCLWRSDTDYQPLRKAA
jgi:transposase